jgi:epoxyqueuosine reductase
MGYLARPEAVERREDPRTILPQCRSILVVGWPYSSTVHGDRDGKVAGYANGPDYHDLLVDKLRTLMASLEGFLGRPFAYRLYTDTGPILERELAQRAGLGWIGKNTCLIHPRQGSYFLLAEALTDVDLEADAAIATDHCGTCTRCLEACPTHCILPDRTIDARRCLSYLTIELRGTIPRDLRPEIGEWLFGCDICQQVCPWNIRFAPTATATHDFPGLAEILRAPPEALRARLQGTAFRRARREGLARNAAVVAGNSGSAEWVPALVALLRNDPESIVRSHAAWALGRIGGEEAHRALRGAQVSEKEEDVRQEIEAALGP